MVADVVKRMKEVQIELFNREIRLLMKGSPYKNDSFNLSLIIDSTCCDISILKYYLNYYENLLNNI